MSTPGEEKPNPAPADDSSKPKTEDTPEELTPEQITALRAEAAEAKTLREKLSTIEEAGKTEADKLKEKADLADKLSPTVEAYKKALQGEVDAQKALLPKEIIDLMPATDNPAEQLEWIRRAKPAAEKVKPGTTLPSSGGRNPGGAADAADSKAKIEKGQSTFHSLKGRRVIGS